MSLWEILASVFFIIVTAALVFLIDRGFRYDPTNKARRIILMSILFWLAVTSVFAFSGMLAEFQKLPPRLLIVLLPPILTAIYLANSKSIGLWLQQLPQDRLIAIQSFRIIMEIILWMLFLGGVIPEQMTFEGRNWDILVGLTAPLVSYMCFRKRSWPVRIAFWWNIAGLIILANIVITAILSTPLPIRIFMNEPANTIIAYWPFVWLPAFVVPVAYTAHILSLRQLRRSISSNG